MKVLNAYSKFLDVLTKILRAILIILLASMVIIMIYNVICRYIFSDAKPWAEELTLYISIFSIMLGLGIASRSDSHLQVDFLTRLYKPKMRCLMAAIWSVVTIVIMAIFAYYSVSLMVNHATARSVTLPITMKDMLPMLDGDLTAVGVAHMKKMGIAFALECPVQAVEPSPVGAKVVCTTKSGDTVTFEAEKVLVAIGRKANTASLDLEAGGIRNDRGRILVNDRMQTNVPGVYAIGDCVFGKAQLAHTASAMGEVAAENIMGHDSTYDESTNPTCVYMEPEAASVGLTEEQCKAKGLDYKVGKFPMSANGKALIINGGEGLVKIISDAKYGEVLGMHIIGPRATDLISEGALAIRLEATVDELISTIHSHPTVTETIREAALNAMGRAIHTKN